MGKRKKRTHVVHVFEVQPAHCAPAPSKPTATSASSHRSFMSQISTNENKTKYYGIMQGIFSTAIIPGNIISHFILKSESPSPAATDDVGDSSGSGSIGEVSGILLNATSSPSGDFAFPDPLKDMTCVTAQF